MTMVGAAIELSAKSLGLSHTVFRIHIYETASFYAREREPNLSRCYIRDTDYVLRCVQRQRI